MPKNNPFQNPNCDNNKCISPKGEVRLLPIGGDGNLILCFSCYNYEINYRKDRNKSLSKENQYKLPAWEDLQVYLS